MMGNGFDKCVGLKTGYDDFYKSLPQNSDNMIIRSIKDNTDLWSDVEEQLGLYYDDEVSNHQDVFIDQKHELEILLEEYLSNKQKRSEYRKPDAIATEMRKSIIDFTTALSTKDAQNINGVKAQIMEAIQYSFIVFNYTNVFDKCLGYFKSKHREIKHNSSGGLYTDSVENAMHVHGLLGDGIILGVDNLKQTKCTSFQEDGVWDYF